MLVCRKHPFKKLTLYFQQIFSLDESGSVVAVSQAQHPTSSPHINVAGLGGKEDLCNVISGWLQKIWDCSSALSFPDVDLPRMGCLPPSAFPHPVTLFSAKFF